jgi:predicted nuclease of predicted toxin-antitoxin system
VKFKIDENLPVEIAVFLSAAGHDATTVIDQGMAGAIDSHIINICSREKRVLITLDLDFADVRVYPPRLFSGIMVMRVVRQDKQHLIDVLTRALPVLKNEPVKQRLWIIEETRIRIRGDGDLLKNKRKI